MAAPFPSLPKISDDNLAKWVRHLGNRPHPRLKPVPNSPSIGTFNLTATVAPAPRQTPPKLDSQYRTHTEGFTKDSSSPDLRRKAGSTVHGSPFRIKSTHSAPRLHAASSPNKTPPKLTGTPPKSAGTGRTGSSSSNSTAGGLVKHRKVTDPKSAKQSRRLVFGGTKPLSARQEEEAPPSLPSPPPQLPAGSPAGSEADPGEKAAPPDLPDAGELQLSQAQAKLPERSSTHSLPSAMEQPLSPKREQSSDRLARLHQKKKVDRMGTSKSFGMVMPMRSPQAEQLTRKRKEAETKREDEDRKIQEERHAMELERKKRKVERHKEKVDRLAQKKERLDISHKRLTLTQSVNDNSPDSAQLVPEGSETPLAAMVGDLDKEESSSSSEEEEVTKPESPSGGRDDYDDDFEQSEEEEEDASEEEDEPSPIKPIQVSLPGWYPELPPLLQLDALHGQQSTAELPSFKPEVKCLGAGKIQVLWELTSPVSLELMWHVRVRSANEDGEWFIVDLDSGRASMGGSMTWKDRALIVQPGLRVWCFCIEDGQKTQLPAFGTIVVHYPGVLVVDFDKHGRQRVPQDWVQFAATAKGATDMQDEIMALIEGKESQVESKANLRSWQLWRRAKKDWWKLAGVDVRRKLRSRRQCPLICCFMQELPEAGDRVAVSCAIMDNAATAASPTDQPHSPLNKALVAQGMAQGMVQGMVQETTAGDLPTKSNSAGALDANTTGSVYTWWPALLCKSGRPGQENEDEEDDDEDSAESKDRPQDLCSCFELPIKLEPWPRRQVVPRAWLSSATPDWPDAERAAKNACIGQVLLSHYGCDPDREPTAEIEENLMHPGPQFQGDMTFRQAKEDPEPLQSERAVRCKVLRELCSAEGVVILVKYMNSSKTARLPLSALTQVWADVRKGRTESYKIYDWQFQQQAPGKYTIYVRQQLRKSPRAPIGDPEEVVAGAQAFVNMNAEGEKIKRQQLVKINKIFTRPSHFEVRFEDVVAESVQYVSNETMRAVFEPEGQHNNGLRRLQHPEVVVHDLPDSIGVVEVQVGVSAGTGSEPKEENIRWSESSAICTVRTRDASLLAPLGPAVRPLSTSRAEVRWLCPESPQALCFKVRIRSTSSKAYRMMVAEVQESWTQLENDQSTDELKYWCDDTGDIFVRQPDGQFGQQVWSMVDAFGEILDAESTMAWRSRIIPLVKDRWVLAYGRVNDEKNPSPTPAVVYEVLDDDSVKIQFVADTEELIIGSDTSEAFLSHDFGDRAPETIPVDYVEAVWCQDAEDFFKGQPSLTCKSAQQVIFKVEKADKRNTLDTDRFCVQLDAEGQEIMDLFVDHETTLSSSVYDATPISGDDDKYSADAMIGSVIVSGLDQHSDYEVCVQALTEGCWTPWTKPTVLKMPRAAYQQRELVLEEDLETPMYKSRLLFLMFLKEYNQCSEFIKDKLDEARYAKIECALESVGPVGERVDSKFRGRLLHVDGPCRMPEPSRLEQQQKIREIVDKGADVNLKENSTGRTPLIYAVEYHKDTRGPCRLAGIQEMINLRAAIDAMNDARQTPLMIAAENGHASVVELLQINDADHTIVNRNGETALLGARVNDRMDRQEQREMMKCRDLLTKDRVEWNDFQEQVLDKWEDTVAAAKAFLKLAFPDEATPSKSKLFVTDTQTQLGKRICKKDNLRLLEQLKDIGETDPEKSESLGQLCAERLLLPQMQAASKVPAPKECSVFTFYLLFSGIAPYRIKDLRFKATELLEYHETELVRMRSELNILPYLTDKDQFIVNAEKRDMYNGSMLHQYHAHRSLPWLTKQSIVNTFEELVKMGAFKTLEECCSWVGELSAQVGASFGEGRKGAYNERVPLVFWGGVYVKWLISEAHRAKDIFHGIAQRLSDEVGVKYTPPPNKGQVRIQLKQKDYASPGLLLLHEALDLMPGFFQKALRADNPDGKVRTVPEPSPIGEAVLILGRLCKTEVSDGSLSVACEAIKSVMKNTSTADADEVGSATATRSIAAENACQEQLKVVDVAVERIRNLKQSAWVNLRALSNIPPRAMVAIEAACVLLQIGPPPKSRGQQEKYWLALQVTLSTQSCNGSLVNRIAELDKEEIKPLIMEHLAQIVANRDFKPEVQQKTVPICGLLCAWVLAVYKYFQARQHFALAKEPESEVVLQRVKSVSARPLVLVTLVAVDGASETDFESVEVRLKECGADAVVWSQPGTLEGPGARSKILEGLAKARASRGLSDEDLPPKVCSIDGEKVRLLFDIRKSKTSNMRDLLCAGGLLDLVRGSIVCQTEEEVQEMYNKCMALTFKSDNCEVVRVKNGFKKPAVGGYADLKCFLQIEYDGGSEGESVYHICELQVHLKRFLDCKSYTHLPYQVDRGDFDPS